MIVVEDNKTIRIILRKSNLEVGRLQDRPLKAIIASPAGSPIDREAVLQIRQDNDYSIQVSYLPKGSDYSSARTINVALSPSGMAELIRKRQISGSYEDGRRNMEIFNGIPSAKI